MKRKDIQLWVNLHYEDIRNTLLFIFVVILLILSFGANSRSTINTDQIKTLSQQNKKLEEQNKVLNIETKNLAEKNQKYTLCLSKIFAQYTHDFIPVEITNLEKCELKDGNNILGGASLTPRGASDKSSVGSSSTKPSSSDNKTVTNNSQSTPAPKSQGLIPDRIPIIGPLL